MKINYFDLLSPSPIKIENAGSIISPKLRDISDITINTYKFYLSILLTDVESYFSFIGQKELFQKLADEEKKQFNIFDLLICNKNFAITLQNSLNFFFVENVEFNAETKYYDVYGNDNSVGHITEENYLDICDIIFQLNGIKRKNEDVLKPKNKKASEILKKIQKGRKEKEKIKFIDKDMELGNIISAVANFHPSLNEYNIWNLTVYQLWDSFYKLINNNIYTIQSTSVAVWGDKDKQFNINEWYKTKPEN